MQTAEKASLRALYENWWAMVEHSATMKKSIKLYPKELGCLFVKNSNDSSKESLFESVVLGGPW